MKFVAIDFETANYSPTSACAIGLVRVEDGMILQQQHYLIRPPSQEFVFTHIHGITWQDVAKEPTFAQLWPKIRDVLHDVDFFAAHNSSFDRKVLQACCDYYQIPYLPQIFTCTVQLARRTWGIRPTNLPNVCMHLDIELEHHQALSDAHACAQIVIKAHKM
jgi:DNA polymerase III subunit epsilon